MGFQKRSLRCRVPASLAALGVNASPFTLALVCAAEGVRVSQSTSCWENVQTRVMPMKVALRRIDDANGSEIRDN